MFASLSSSFSSSNLGKRAVYLIIRSLMHPRLGNLGVTLVENVFVLSAIHHGSSNLLAHPILLDSEESCGLTPDMLRWSRRCRDTEILDSKLA
jgi:hypothetical protein